MKMAIFIYMNMYRYTYGFSAEIHTHDIYTAPGKALRVVWRIWLKITLDNT